MNINTCRYSINKNNKRKIKSDGCNRRPSARMRFSVCMCVCVCSWTKMLKMKVTLKVIFMKWTTFRLIMFVSLWTMPILILQLERRVYQLSFFLIAHSHFHFFQRSSKVPFREPIKMEIAAPIAWNISAFNLEITLCIQHWRLSNIL